MVGWVLPAAKMSSFGSTYGAGGALAEAFFAGLLPDFSTSAILQGVG